MAPPLRSPSSVSTTQVTILGAGTSIPAQGYSPSGIHLRVAGEHLLLDAGPGTLQRLQAIGVTVCDLDRIFLTHYHLDHCLDLAAILFAARIPDWPRRKPLTIYGPPGLTRLYRQLNRAFHRWLEPRGFRFTCRELGETTLRLPGYTVQARRMRHAAVAIGYRVETRGARVVYSGDTDVCRAIISLGQGADVLILECSVPDERKVAGHLTPSECGRIAAEARCRHLVLTHFYPVFQGYDIRARVRRAFRGRLTLARDFTAVTL